MRPDEHVGVSALQLSEQQQQQKLSDFMSGAPFSDGSSDLSSDSNRLHALPSDEAPGVLKATPRTAALLSARLQAALEQQLQATGVEQAAAGEGPEG